MSEGTALIKFTKSEIQLLINSLHMSVSTVVPCVDSGEWKRPYEKLLKDLKGIKDKGLLLKEKGEKNERIYKKNSNRLF